MDETRGAPWVTLIGTPEGPPDANGFITFRFEPIRADGLTDSPVIFSEIRVRVGGRWSTLSYLATSPGGEWRSRDDGRVSMTFTDAEGVGFTAEHPGFDVGRKESLVARSSRSQLSGTIKAPVAATMKYCHGLTLS